MDDVTPDIRAQFLQGMSAAACTVSVVTTDGAHGRAGVTVSAMSSVSADGTAPTLVVCVHNLSPAAKTIIENGSFCVNVLRDDQSYISDTFAGLLKTPSGDKFDCAKWRPMATGSPRVSDPLTAFDCRVQSAQQVGTHFVFIGEVQEIYVSSGGSPLIFANRAYGSATKISPARGDAVTGETLRVGTLHTFGPYLLPSIIAKLEAASGPVNLALHEGDQRRLLELLRSGDIDVAFLYDFDLEDDLASQTLALLKPCVLLPDGHPLADQDQVSLRDLMPLRLVLLDAPPSRDYFLSLFKGIGEPLIGYRVQSFEMVRGMVGHGLGYSLLATKPASAKTYDGRALSVRPILEDIPASRLVLVWRRAAAMSKIAEAFLRHCNHAFGLDQD